MKVWIGVLIILLVGSNAWWFYRSIDQGITAAHQPTQREVNRHIAELLASLVVTVPRGESLEETLRLLRAFSRVGTQHSQTASKKARRRSRAWNLTGLEPGSSTRFKAASFIARSAST